MHRKSFSWWTALAVCACVAGCGSDPPAPSSGGCTPACSAGYVCQGSACVAACNPACGAGESCVVRNGTSACVTSEAGVPNDLGGADVPLTDTGNPPPPPPGDSSVPPADAPPGGDAGMCGLTGQPCCGGRVCLGNGICDNNRCGTITPAMGECTTTAQCPSGMVCQGLNSNCMAPRWCLSCGQPGMRPLGAQCMSSSECSTGLCFGGLCSAACVFGRDGDARCQALNPQMTCVQITNSNRGFSVDGSTVTSVSTFGGCARSCRRDGDCATGTVCALNTNLAADRFDQICVVPSAGTLAGGAMCDPNPPAPDGGMPYPPNTFCQSASCIPTVGEHTGYCPAFCVTEADCPANAPVCDEFLSWIRPVSRGNQTIRNCRPRP